LSSLDRTLLSHDVYIALEFNTDEWDITGILKYLMFVSISEPFLFLIPLYLKSIKYKIKFLCILLNVNHKTATGFCRNLIQVQGHALQEIYSVSSFYWDFTPWMSGLVQVHASQEILLAFLVF